MNKLITLFIVSLCITACATNVDDNASSAQAESATKDDCANKEYLERQTCLTAKVKN